MSKQEAFIELRKSFWIFRRDSLRRFEPKIFEEITYWETHLEDYLTYMGLKLIFGLPYKEHDFWVKIPPSKKSKIKEHKPKTYQPPPTKPSHILEELPQIDVIDLIKQTPITEPEPNKCSHCGKEVKYLHICPFCNQLFCMEHRPTTAHNCPTAPPPRKLKSKSVYPQKYSIMFIVIILIGLFSGLYRLNPIFQVYINSLIDDAVNPLMEELKRYWNPGEQEKENDTSASPVVEPTPTPSPTSTSTPISTPAPTPTPCNFKVYIKTTPNNPWIGEDVNISATIRNIGGVRGTETLTWYLEDKEIGKKEIFLDPEQSVQISFSFHSNNTGRHSMSIIWETGECEWVVTIIGPENPFTNPEYYYGVAKRYVSENYEVPSNKDIEGLVEFLDQIELPEYESGEFDCSESVSLLEWFLEGGGFHTYIIRNYQWGEMSLGPHTWIQVETTNGTVAIEAVELTEDWGLENYDAKPTGIVIKPDGTFKEFAYDYRLFLEWKKKYPSSKYVVDPNITFEEWQEERESMSIGLSFGIPSNIGYYMERLREECPADLIEGKTIGNTHYYIPVTEFDWWNVEPFDNIFPFSEWR